MTKWEKWIKEYGKRNQRKVLKLIIGSTKSFPRFNKSNERAVNALRLNKRFYLSKDEKLDLQLLWHNHQMSIERALALSWACNCCVYCFSWVCPGSEIVLTYDGYYARMGDSYRYSSVDDYESKGLLGGITIYELLTEIRGYKEDEIWKLK